jgi:phage terminase small subunit
MEKIPKKVKKLAKNLTAKQLKFADAYIELGSLTDAAKSAGYSAKTARTIGNENINKPAVSAYVQAKMEYLQSQKVADQREIMEFLTATMRGEVKEKVISANGKEFDIPTATKDRLKATELLGKRYSLFTDKVQTDISGEIELKNIQSLDTRTLRKLAKQDTTDYDFKKYEK